MVTMNPLVSIVLGITLFADKLRSGPWIAAEVVALGVLVAGVVILARSPLVAGARGEHDPGEMLGGARRRAVDADRAAEGGGSVDVGAVPAGSPAVVDGLPLGGGRPAD